ncbi:MAG: hypothetical protein A4E29_01404 [Methanomassiliicoccales archaeon PtaB.Bin134]|jgi:hypothetical protein|nr:MAG: hypothetical protein A4E29_01404 [Methanomassiliicoccales archaeon PtaB.Bin134]
MNTSTECQSRMVIAFVRVWMAEITAAAFYIMTMCF